MHTARWINRRVVALATALALASAVLVIGGAGTPAAAATFEQCEGAFEGGGQGANCQVTVENFLELATGDESSTVTVLACNGGANTVTTCPGEPVVQNYPFLTDVVEQCNYSVNGGGGTLHCSVVLINTIIGAGTTSAPSVNQCNNSFDSLPLPEDSACDPVQATTNATITQCNDSMNGGTQVSMNCTVGASTMSSALPVTITQCNNSVNGGGSLLECSTMITTVFVPAADEGGGARLDGGEGESSGDELAATGASTDVAALAAALTLLLGSLMLALTRTRGVRQAARL